MKKKNVWILICMVYEKHDELLKEESSQRLLRYGASYANCSNIFASCAPIRLANRRIIVVDPTDATVENTRDLPMEWTTNQFRAVNINVFSISNLINDGGQEKTKKNKGKLKDELAKYDENYRTIRRETIEKVRLQKGIVKLNGTARGNKILRENSESSSWKRLVHNCPEFAEFLLFSRIPSNAHPTLIALYDYGIIQMFG